MKLENVWEQPEFLNDDKTPVHLFELFFDDEVIHFIVQDSKKFAMFKGYHNYDIIYNEIKHS